MRLLRRVICWRMMLCHTIPLASLDGFGGSTIYMSFARTTESLAYLAFVHIRPVNAERWCLTNTISRRYLASSHARAMLSDKLRGAFGIESHVRSGEFWH